MSFDYLSREPEPVRDTNTMRGIDPDLGDPLRHKDDVVAVLRLPIPVSALDRCAKALEQAYGPGLRLSQAGSSMLITRPEVNG